MFVVGEIVGFEPGPHHVILVTQKNGTYCFYIWHVTLIIRIRRLPWSINRRNSLPCTLRTSRQKSCNKRVGYLVDVTLHNILHWALESYLKWTMLWLYEQ